MLQEDEIDGKSNPIGQCKRIKGGVFTAGAGESWEGLKKKKKKALGGKDREGNAG